jgi:hypothetical protein
MVSNCAGMWSAFLFDPQMSCIDVVTHQFSLLFYLTMLCAAASSITVYLLPVEDRSLLIVVLGTSFYFIPGWFCSLALCEIVSRLERYRSGWHAYRSDWWVFGLINALALTCLSIPIVAILIALYQPAPIILLCIVLLSTCMGIVISCTLLLLRLLIESYNLAATIKRIDLSCDSIKLSDGPIRIHD